MRTTLAIALCLSLLLVGCDEADWSGTYAGNGTATWSRSVMEGPAGADGAAMADVVRGNESTSADVIARRVDEAHYVLVTPYCELRTEQQPDPNLHNGQIAPGQTCTVPIGDQRVAMAVSGTLMFGRDNPTLHVDFHGDARADANGVASGDTSQFSWTFDGQSRAD